MENNPCLIGICFFRVALDWGSESGSEGVCLRATLTDAKIDSALSNYEEDTGTKFTALSEFEWYAPALLGGGTSVSSSQTFPLEIVREIHIND